jgi:hypothetical protein
LQAWIHVARVAQILKTYDTIFAICWPFLYAYFVKFVVGLSTACWQMEIFVLFAAWFLAISYTFALALYAQNASLITELALADLHPASVLVLEGKSRRTDFHNSDLLIKVLVFNCEQRAYKWL